MVESLIHFRFDAKFVFHYMNLAGVQTTFCSCLLDNLQGNYSQMFAAKCCFLDAL